MKLKGCSLCFYWKIGQISGKKGGARIAEGCSYVDSVTFLYVLGYFAYKANLPFYFFELIWRHAHPHYLTPTCSPTKNCRFKSMKDSEDIVIAFQNEHLHSLGEAAPLFWVSLKAKFMIRLPRK
jgi:hypothetical protein